MSPHRSATSKPSKKQVSSSSQAARSSSAVQSEQETEPSDQASARYRCLCSKCTNHGSVLLGKPVVLRTWKQHRADDLARLTTWRAEFPQRTPPAAYVSAASRQPIPLVPTAPGHQSSASDRRSYLHYAGDEVGSASATSTARPAPQLPPEDGMDESDAEPPHEAMTGSFDFDDGEDLPEPATGRDNPMSSSSGLEGSGSPAFGADGDGAAGGEEGAVDEEEEAEDEEEELRKDDSAHRQQEQEGYSYDRAEESDEEDEEDGGDDDDQAPEPLSLSGDALLLELIDDYDLGPQPQEPLSLPRLSTEERLSLRHYRRWLQTRGTVKAYSEHALTLRELGHRVMSLYRVKKLVTRITGLVSRPVDMCINSCVAFVGKHAKKTVCDFKRKKRTESVAPDGTKRFTTKTTTCDEPRYDDKGKPRRQYYVMSILDRLRALYRNPAMSKILLYRHEHLEALRELQRNKTWDTHRFADSVDGVRNLRLHARGLLQDRRDVALSFATDGAQLLANKDSSVWIITASSLNTPPQLRFKRAHQFVLASIPGPNQPGDIDSFFWPLAKELAQLSVGAWVWDGAEQEWFQLRVHLVGLYADQPGSAKLNKMTGTQGRKGCRFCMMEACYGCTGSSTGQDEDVLALGPPDAQAVPGKKVKKTAYFPLKTITALVKDNESRQLAIAALTGGDATRALSYDPWELPLRNDATFTAHLDELHRCKTIKSRKESATGNGISGLPLLAFSQAHTHPDFFPPDVYHLYTHNTFALLWRTFQARVRGDPLVMSTGARITFGQAVTAAAKDLPGDFGDPARDPHRFSNSHFKMFEWSLVFHAYLGPFLHHLGVNGPVFDMLLRLLDGMSTSVQDAGCSYLDIQFVNRAFTDFVQAWEEYFIRDDAALLSRARVSIHMLLHIGRQVSSTGSLRACSQAACERTIGTIKDELRAHKEMYTTVRIRSHLIEQYNALAMILDAEEGGVAEYVESSRLEKEKRTRLSTGEKIKAGWLAANRARQAGLLSFLRDLGLDVFQGRCTLHLTVRITRSASAFRVRGVLGEDTTTRRRSSCVAIRDPSSGSGVRVFRVALIVTQLADEPRLPHAAAGTVWVVGHQLEAAPSRGAVCSHWIGGRWSTRLQMEKAEHVQDLMATFTPAANALTYAFPRKNGMGGYTEWWQEGHVSGLQEQQASV